MQINVVAKMSNLCAPVRAEMEQTGYSHLSVLNACNAHLGKLKGEQKGDDKRGDGKVNVKKDTFKMSITPGRVLFSGTADIVASFIAWHDAIAKAHQIASMDSVKIPSAFEPWLQFAKAKTEETVSAS